MNSKSINNNSSIFNNNINFDMDKNTPGCSSKSLEDRSGEEFQNFNDIAGDSNEDSDAENPINLSDSYDELPVSDDDDDVQLSSPSNSLNSDVDQRWYAFRVNMIDDNHNDINNRLPDNQLLQPPPAQNQDEDETEFLEMDFEPDTNSEIENEATLPNGFHNQIPQPDFLIMHNLPPPARLPPAPQVKEVVRPPNKNTGAKPKQPSVQNRPQKVIKHASDGDNVFKISMNNNNHIESTSHSSIYGRGMNSEEVYNLGASGSRSSHVNERLLKDQHNYNNESNGFLKIHKSPSKSSSHHTHKHQRLQEEQNDQFLFEIEPIKPRNSVTIYTTNCDEKILIDALTSLNLEPNREAIASYFNRSKPPAVTKAGTASNCELNLVDYLIYRSKLNCNYLKLIELIQRACKSDEDESYSDKQFDINFYPLDLFSTTPEMIEVPVDEIVQRWTPQTDLSPLINIRNKFFYQTNVLGKIVNIIRRINQKHPAPFKEKESIKIPQFYVSGYITITMTNHGFKSP